MVRKTTKAVIPTTLVVKILTPVWVATHKAKVGDIVALDIQTGQRLIANNQAVEYSDDTVV